MKSRDSLASRCLAVLGLLISLTSLAAERNPVFRAGAYAIDITPKKLPIRVAGSIAEKYAGRITDPLHARCLVLDDGRTRIAISVVDSCLLSRATVDAAKQKVQERVDIPSSHILISATHTHSAPAVKGVHGNDPEIDYRAFLTHRIAEGLVAAFENLAPARIGWGVGTCSEFVFCRRWEIKNGRAFTVPFTGRDTNRAQMNPGYDNPDKEVPVGPVDPAVTVLSLQTKTGRPLALLANYSTHYAGAPGISSDYFGAFAGEMAKLLGAEGQTPPFVAIMSNGTSGDANCIDFSSERRAFDRFTVAKAAARAAQQALGEIEYLDWAPIAVNQTEIELEARVPTPEEVAAAQAYLATHLTGGRVATWTQDYARETVLLSQLPPVRNLLLQTISIGDLGIAAIPCEVFGSTGLAIKQLSPFAVTMNVGLANGYFGYLPPPEQFALGGYTTWRARSSCLEIGAEPRIRHQVVAMLRQLARQGTLANQ